MDGLLRCSRYAFGPNRLHYCGPDANREVLSYIQEGAGDLGLEALLKQFDTMYPYLRFIARSHHIGDPFDWRVVEAYWIGNGLLDTIDKKKFYRHIIDDHRVKDKIKSKPLEQLAEKIRMQALPHHSFHVFNIWKRTGHVKEAHTLDSMDQCRISCGTITRIEGPVISITTKPLILVKNALALGEPIGKKISRMLEGPAELDALKIGDTISAHWGVVCETLTPQKAAQLERYTLQSIKLANSFL